MELKRRQKLAAGLLAGAWLLVVGWQVQEHLSVVAAAQSDLRSRSHEIAGTLGAVHARAEFSRRGFSGTPRSRPQGASQ